MSYSFVIWLDADSCPSPVRNFIIDYAKAKLLNVKFVANREISHPKNNPLFEMIITSSQSGAADDYIFDHCKTGDMVVTRDILFAERLVNKNIFVMNDKGTRFSKENIRLKVSERNFNLNLSMLGLNENKGKSSFNQKDLKKFAQTFDTYAAQQMVNELYSKK